MATAQMRTGAWGERVAARRLRLHGWWVLARRERSFGAEIDLVASRGGVLAICEVKTRTRLGPIGPVGPRQIERIRRAAEAYCELHPELAPLQVRLDLILVVPRRMRPARVLHVRHGLESPALERPPPPRRPR